MFLHEPQYHLTDFTIFPLITTLEVHTSTEPQKLWIFLHETTISPQRLYSLYIYHHTGGSNLTWGVVKSVLSMWLVFSTLIGWIWKRKLVLHKYSKKKRLSTCDKFLSNLMDKPCSIGMSIFLYKPFCHGSIVDWFEYNFSSYFVFNHWNLSPFCVTSKMCLWNVRDNGRSK